MRSCIYTNKLAIDDLPEIDVSQIELRSRDWYLDGSAWYDGPLWGLLEWGNRTYWFDYVDEGHAGPRFS